MMVPHIRFDDRNPNTFFASSIRRSEMPLAIQERMWPNDPSLDRIGALVKRKSHSGCNIAYFVSVIFWMKLASVASVRRQTSEARLKESLKY